MCALMVVFTNAAIFPFLDGRTVRYNEIMRFFSPLPDNLSEHYFPACHLGKNKACSKLYHVFEIYLYTLITFLKYHHGSKSSFFKGRPDFWG